MLGDRDEALRRAREGDEEAWSWLVERYHPVLYGYARRLTRDHGAADDLCQETWLRACRGLDGFETGTSLRAWLLRIMTNLFRDRLRRRARRVETVPVVEQEVPGSSGEPAGRLLGSELGAAFEAALQELPAEQREVLLLRTEEGLAHEEIAEITDAAPATVRWRLYRARDRLRRLLAGWLPDRQEEGSS